MTVPFKELAGSPVEQYGEEGFTARREFLIAWEDREAFAAEVLGTASEHGGRGELAYPGKSTVYAASLRYEPLDPDNPDAQVLSDLAEGLNRYSSSFARARVEYRTRTLDRGDTPEVPADAPVEAEGRDGEHKHEARPRPREDETAPEPDETGREGQRESQVKPYAAGAEMDQLTSDGHERRRVLMAETAEESATCLAQHGPLPSHTGIVQT